MEYYKDMGYWISDERKGQGVKQKDLAKAVGVTQSFICDFEKGRKKISAFKLWKITEFLDCW